MVAFLQLLLLLVPLALSRPFSPSVSLLPSLNFTTPFAHWNITSQSNGWPDLPYTVPIIRDFLEFEIRAIDVKDLSIEDALLVNLENLNELLESEGEPSDLMRFDEEHFVVFTLTVQPWLPQVPQITRHQLVKVLDTVSGLIYAYGPASVGGFVKIASRPTTVFTMEVTDPRAKAVLNPGLERSS